MTNPFKFGAALYRITPLDASDQLFELQQCDAAGAVIEGGRVLRVDVDGVSECQRVDGTMETTSGAVVPVTRGTPLLRFDTNPAVRQRVAAALKG